MISHPKLLTSVQRKHIADLMFSSVSGDIHVIVLDGGLKLEAILTPGKAADSQ